MVKLIFLELKDWRRVGIESKKCNVKFAMLI